MSTTFSGVKCGMPIDADWELEKELFNWGVLPEHEALVMDFVNHHLVESHLEHSDIVIWVDSEFPGDEDVVWTKSNPELQDTNDLGNYIHFWVNPTSGMLCITVLRPDLQEEYFEPEEEGWEPEDEERIYPGGMTKTEWDNAKNGEEG